MEHHDTGEDALTKKFTHTLMPKTIFVFIIPIGEQTQTQRAHELVEFVVPQDCVERIDDFKARCICGWKFAYEYIV